MLIIRLFSPKNFLLFLSSIIVLLMIYSSLFLKVTNINTLVILFIIALNAFIIFLSVKINRYSNKVFLIMLIIVSLTIYFLWNIYAVTVPVSDYKILLEGARGIAAGTFLKRASINPVIFIFITIKLDILHILPFL